MQNGYVKRDNDSAYNYYTFPQEKGFNYYITDTSCTKLIRYGKSFFKKSGCKKVKMKDYINGQPDTIGITHTNFNFNIGLKRLEKL